jgi:hydrogenase maturation protease
VTVRVRLIGCGNPEAGDDALGLVTLERVRVSLPDDVEAVTAGPATRVLDLLDDVETVVVVDAVRSTDGGREPGTLIHAEGLDALATELRSSLSSHGVGLPEAVGLAAALGTAPHVVFHGVEVADVTMGAPLSAAVRDALPALEAAVLADVGAIA